MRFCIAPFVLFAQVVAWLVIAISAVCEAAEAPGPTSRLADGRVAFTILGVQLAFPMHHVPEMRFFTGFCWDEHAGVKAKLAASDNRLQPCLETAMQQAETIQIRFRMRFRDASPELDFDGPTFPWNQQDLTIIVSRPKSWLVRRPIEFTGSEPVDAHGALSKPGPLYRRRWFSDGKGEPQYSWIDYMLPAERRWMRVSQPLRVNCVPKSAEWSKCSMTVASSDGRLQLMADWNEEAKAPRDWRRIDLFLRDYAGAVLLDKQAGDVE